MSEKKGYLAKDGKYYDNPFAHLAANLAVENNEKQTKNLEKLNQLKMLETMQKEKELQQARIQEKERIEFEKEKEYNKQKHEKEMLLLKMFDKVSIPLEMFRKFEREILDNNDIDITEEDRQRLFDITEKLDLNLKFVLSEKSGIDNMIANNTNLAVSKRKVKYNDKYKIVEDFVNMKQKDLSDNDIKIIKDNEDIIELYDKWDNMKKYRLLYLLGMIISIIIMFIGGFEEVRFGIGMIILIICEILLLASFKPKKLLETINDKVNKQMQEDVKAMREEAINKIKNNEMQEILDKYDKVKTELIVHKLDFLYDFRIHHYNMQIEKLFYDSEFVKECEDRGIEFKSINKSQIIGNGTFEDYFEFFNNFKENYSEYKKLTLNKTED